jgi:ATP-dependent protease HslVU (ClpYQ) peptidase subunit
MNDIDQPRHNVWAIKSVVNQAVISAQELMDNQEVTPKKLQEMILVIADLVDKTADVRWIDEHGFNHAVTLYKNIIKNI